MSGTAWELWQAWVQKRADMQRREGVDRGWEPIADTLLKLYPALMPPTEEPKPTTAAVQEERKP